MKYFFVSIFVLVSFFTYAQSGNSPYSRLGLGDLSDRNSLYNMTTGTFGVSYANPLFVNIGNPALLPNYKLTGFDAALYADYKTLDKQNTRQRNQGGNLAYAALVFPIHKKASMSLSFQPYSTVNYQDNVEEKLPNSPNFVQYIYRGVGGISQASLGFGIEVYKNLSVGIQSSINFGSIRNESKSLIDDPTQLYLIELLNRTNFLDFSHRLGIAYKIDLGEKDKLNIGIQQDLSTNWSLSSYKAVQRKTITDVTIRADTLRYDESFSMQLPAASSFGISLSRDFSYAVMLEYQMQNWQNFKSINPNDIFANSFKVGFGGEWTPNFNSINNYLARINYRLGVSYQKTPYVVKGTQLEDYRIHAGLSLPMNRSLSSLNLGFQAGRRGVMDNGLIRETYYKVFLGLTINDRWFQKRKIY